MDNDWKKRLGVVYSTNPEFKYSHVDDSPAAASLSPREQKLIVGIDRRNRSGKTVTLVTGFCGSEEDLADLGRTLKVKCGVGGSVKNGEIAVQGDFRDRIVQLLWDMGFIRAKRGN